MRASRLQRKAVPERLASAASGSRHLELDVLLCYSLPVPVAIFKFSLEGMPDVLGGEGKGSGSGQLFELAAYAHAR